MNPQSQAISDNKSIFIKDFEALLAKYIIKAPQYQKTKSKKDPNATITATSKQIQAWFKEASQKAKRLKIASHTVKAIHTNAQGNSVLIEPTQLFAYGLPLIGSHSLPQSFILDAVGDAGTMKIASVLQSKIDDKTILQLLREKHPDILPYLGSDEASRKAAIQALLSTLIPSKETTTHPQAKQILWLNGNDANDDSQYIVLSPLYASSLVHHIHNRILDDLYSDEAKAVRNAKRTLQPHSNESKDYPNLLERKIGGSNPQNISKLNVERRGRCFLLPSLPPNWQPWPLRPVSSLSLLNMFQYRHRAKNLIKTLATLHNLDDEHQQSLTLKILNALSDEFAAFTTDLLNLPKGWTLAPTCRLSPSEKAWLEPHAHPWPTNRTDLHAEISKAYMAWISSKMPKKIKTQILSPPIADPYAPEPQAKKTKDGPEFRLYLPHLRIQGANCLSSALTWGFPANTAFQGFVWAMERQIRQKGLHIQFNSFAIISHQFQALVSNQYPRSLKLNRNPVNRKGEASPINEEGRANMTISIILQGNFLQKQKTYPYDQLENMSLSHIRETRMAGGSILPNSGRPFVSSNPSGLEYQTLIRDAAKLHLHPGFILASRPELLNQRYEALQKINHPRTDVIEAWLDFIRINRAYQEPNKLQNTPSWEFIRYEPGNIVPISIGYGGIASINPPHSVAMSRCPGQPFQHVESLLSFGEWIGLHRITEQDIDDIFWKPYTRKGLYLTTGLKTPSWPD